ncbi:MAG: replication initiation negative regulator SeqA [Vibrionaceae bacterium]
MKIIEIDDDLYRYIASQTQHIGEENASDILRRLLLVPKSTSSLPQGALDAENTKLSQLAHATPLTVLTPDRQLDVLLQTPEFLRHKSTVSRFMLVLAKLYQIDSRSFSQAALLKGRKRVYFADNEQDLLANGRTTKPRLIPHTPYWVITNTNTGRKRQIIEQVMYKMGFSDAEAARVSSAISREK